VSQPQWNLSLANFLRKVVCCGVGNGISYVCLDEWRFGEDKLQKNQDVHSMAVFFCTYSVADVAFRKMLAAPYITGLAFSLAALLVCTIPSNFEV
jgi:hypothetical protein